MRRSGKRIRKSAYPSIREGIDNLPFGIAFANQAGIVILCNHTLHRISRVLCGGELQNAVLFWESVTGKGEKTPEGAYILRLEDGTGWLLMRKECAVGGGTVYEITAQDALERIRMIDRISEGNERLESIGQRLRQYHKNALELGRRRELLERKEYTHDEFGKLLVATRYYLTGGSADVEKLWHRWNINAALMLEESRLTPEGDLLENLHAAAVSVGVSLSVTGDRPRDSVVSEILLAAGGECLTNLLRHTRSRELFIRVENRKDADVLTFSDSGEAPGEGSVTEGGGLSALRRRTEDAGGTMQVHLQPRFQLILTVPVGKVETPENAIPCVSKERRITDSDGGEKDDSDTDCRG